MQVHILQRNKIIEITFAKGQKAPEKVHDWIIDIGFIYNDRIKKYTNNQGLNFDVIEAMFANRAWENGGIGAVKRQETRAKKQDSRPKSQEPRSKKPSAKVRKLVPREEVLDGVPVLSAKEQNELGITADGLGKLSDPKVLDKINELILKGIKENKAPWQNPLEHPFVPAKSFVAQKHYSGVNAIMLGFLGSSDKGYYITAKQIKDLGGKLKKGANEENNVFFYNRYFYDTVKNKFVPIEKHNPDNEDEEARMTLRNYQVYAIEDTEGIDHSHLPSLRVIRKFSDIEQGEHFIKHLRKDAAKIIHKKVDSNSYSVGADIVTMSIKSDFVSEERYYKTLCHELVHSTGHPKRLNRTFGKTFGDKNYAKEELVAEIGASYLCSEIGILFSTINNTSAYLQSWLGALKNDLKKDKNLILKAMTQAYQAVEWLMDGIPNYLVEDKQDSTTNKQGEKVSVDEVLKDIKKTKATLRKLKKVGEGKHTPTKAEMDSLLEFGKKYFVEDKDEFYKKISKVNTIPVVVANAFSHKYNPDKKRTSKQSSDAFWLDIKALQKGVTTKRKSSENSKQLGNVSSKSSIPGTLTVSELINRPFNPVKVSPMFKTLIGDFELPCHILLYGKGGRGKSGLAFLYAKDMLSIGKRVLYASKEQFYNPTLSHLLRSVGLDIKGDQLIIAPEYETKNYNPSMFDVVILDSKDSFGIKDPEDFEEMTRKYPKTSFVALSQSTKEDNFLGAGAWQNVIDTMLHVYEKGKVRTGEKNRWGASGEVTFFQVPTQEEALA